jgi:hypothetical protein
MVFGSTGPFEEIAQPAKLEIVPGLFTEATDRTALKRWKDGDHVRFHNALPQKIGGWTQPTIGGAVLRGSPRRVHEWRSLDRQNWIAVGTSSKLYLLNGGIYHDITPIRKASSLGANPIETENESSLVTITDAAHGATVGDWVAIAGAAAVGGITLSGEYAVTSVTSGSKYVIDAGVDAASTATGGGSSIVVTYEINNGGSDTGFAYGWGTCTWGSGTWGTPRGDCSTFRRKLRIWSLDNWGEDLVASPSEGAVYHWDRTLGPTSRAVLIPGAPSTNRRIIVSPQNRQLICLGASAIDGSPDPLLIRVSDNEDFTDFVPAILSDEAESNVYTKRIDSGSEIITGFRTRKSVIAFTDLGVHIMQPDPDLVYEVTQVSEGNSIIGPNAGVEVDGTVRWMSFDKFMKWDGVISEIPCEVWSKVFGKEPGQGINRAQADKVYAWHNDVFSEIWWHYPSANSSECDSYVVFNYREGTWTYGTMNRTAATRKSAFYDNRPLAWSSAGVMYKHEDGVDDVTAALPAFVETYDTELGEGKEQLHISRLVPDNVRQNGDIIVTLKAKRRPEDSAYVSKTYVVEPGTKEFGTRSRGRQVAVRFASADVGDDWRIGPYTAYVQPDGER